MQTFVAAVKDLWDKKRVVDQLKDELADASKSLETAKSLALKAMEAMEIDKQHVPGCGTIYRQRSFSVQVPKESEDKKLLFSWIAATKGPDVLDNMLSIHSASLNSFYKAELEIAKEQGNVDFAIPGIAEPSVYYTLGMRAK